MKRDGSVKVFKSFFAAFREEFKQGFALAIVYLVIGVTLVADNFIVYFSGLEVPMLGQVIMCILAILALIGLCYIFPVQAYFRNSVLNIIKNAWIMAICNLPYSIVISLLYLVPLVLLILWPAVFIRTIIIWLLIGGSLFAYTSAELFVKVLKKYE